MTMGRAGFSSRPAAGQARSRKPLRLRRNIVSRSMQLERPWVLTFFFLTDLRSAPGTTDRSCSCRRCLRRSCPAEGVSRHTRYARRPARSARESTLHAFRIAQVEFRPSRKRPLPGRAGLSAGFLEGPANGHHFTDRLHLGGQARVSLSGILERQNAAILVTT